MKRHGKEFSSNNDDRRSFGGRNGAPPRGGRSFGGSQEGGGYPSRERRFGGDDRRPSFRREGGSEGGYGRPQRSFGEGRSFDRPRSEGFDRPRFDRPRFDRNDSGSDKPQRRREEFDAPKPRMQAAPAPQLVSAKQLKEGIAQANRALADVIEQFGASLEGDYDIGSLEVTVSFSEAGKFLGFGRGGAVSMTLALSPLDAESVIESMDEHSHELPDDNEDMLEAAADILEMDDALEDGAEDVETLEAAGDVSQAAASSDDDASEGVSAEQTQHFDA